MTPVQETSRPGSSEVPTHVSGRFLSDFFGLLEGQGVAATDLLGDLPIPIDEAGGVSEAVEWRHFADFMRRLEVAVDGPGGLERCGELIGRSAPARALRGLAGLAASPHALYRAAARWALRRAMPGIETRLVQREAGRLEIHARLADGLRACPQIFHFATGGARALPRLIGLRDAVVTSAIDEREARYQITLPPSATLRARVGRFLRALFSAGSVVRFLEAQQLELHAKHEALQRAHDALAESERRLRAMTDAAVDVLCELDADGRVVYVSASVQELIGYSPEQVAGSHYRLWVPSNSQEATRAGFEAMKAMPAGHSTQVPVVLHGLGGREIKAELTGRSHATPDGDWRLVCILRDRAAPRGARATEPFELPAESPIEETASMSRLVEGALLQAPDGGVEASWIESRKLVDTIRDGVLADEGARDVDLRIDLSGAPAEVFTDANVLTTGLVALIDGALQTRPARLDGAPAERRTSRRVELSLTFDDTARPADAADSLGSVAFRLMLPDPERSERELGEGELHDAAGELCLGMAAKAAQTLGGSLASDGLRSDGADATRLVLSLPQPERPLSARP